MQVTTRYRVLGVLTFARLKATRAFVMGIGALATWLLGVTPVVAAPVWQPEVPLSHLDAYSRDQHVVVDDTGTAIAVWTEYADERVSIVASERAPGEDWGARVTIARTTGAYLTSLGIDGTGAVTLAWSELSDRAATTYRHDVVRVARRPAKGAWSRPSTIFSNAVGVGLPSLAVNASGEAVLAFSVGEAGAGYQITAVRRDSTGTWGPASRVGQAGPGLRPSPRVVLADDGIATAAWSWLDGAWCTDTATQEPGGEWGTVTRLQGGNGWKGGVPAMSVDPSGRVTAVWPFELYPQFQMVTRTRGTDGVWGDPKVLAEASSPTYYMDAPAVIDDDAGNTTAAWTEYPLVAGVSSRLVSATRTTGQDWAAPVPVGEGRGYPSLAVAADGTVEALWKAETVLQASKPPGGEWSSLKVIGDGGHNGFGSADIAVAPTGGPVVAVWDHVPAFDDTSSAMPFEVVRAAAFDEGSSDGPTSDLPFDGQDPTDPGAPASPEAPEEPAAPTAPNDPIAPILVDDPTGTLGERDVPRERTELAPTGGGGVETAGGTARDAEVGACADGNAAAKTLCLARIARNDALASCKAGPAAKRALCRAQVNEAFAKASATATKTTSLAKCATLAGTNRAKCKVAANAAYTRAAAKARRATARARCASLSGKPKRTCLARLS